MNPVGWFEIYVNDLPRAAKFYETVLKKPLSKLDSPSDEIKMMAFPMEKDASGATGALAKMDGMRPGGNSTIVYFVTEDCAGGLARRSGRREGDEAEIRDRALRVHRAGVRYGREPLRPSFDEVSGANVYDCADRALAADVACRTQRRRQEQCCRRPAVYRRLAAQRDWNRRSVNAGASIRFGGNHLEGGRRIAFILKNSTQSSPKSFNGAVILRSNDGIVCGNESHVHIARILSI